jgi:hypothetical protein
MDLSKLSDEDLIALKSGDLSKVSDSGLMILKGAQGAADDAPKKEKAPGFSLSATPLDSWKRAKQDIPYLAAGALRGAGSIGASLLTPIDALVRKAGISNDYFGRTDRRESMDAVLQDMGADLESVPFKVGKIGTEVAGTLGAGGFLAKGAQAAKLAPSLVSALKTGGTSAGASTPFWPGAAAKVVGGAATGGASAALVNPTEENIKQGTAYGGGLAALGAAASPAAQWMSRYLMHSALKPGAQALRTGDYNVAIDTLLQKGISPTQGGLKRLVSEIDDLNNQISSAIGSSTAKVDKYAPLQALADTSQKFAKQVNPTPDLNAIHSVATDYLNHPLVTGADMPVQLAQAMKQGTYQVLKGKYGEVGSAATEAQKALARGLKDEIAAAVPGVGKLNAEETKLLKTLDITEYRALMALNSNPMGLTWLSNNPGRMAAFMADRSTAFKALLARMLNRSNQVAQGVGPGVAPMAGVLAAQE